jgi:hypothetical protein
MGGIKTKNHLTLLYMKKANLALLAVHKIVSEYICRKNLCVHGEDAKREKIEDISANNGPT